ncbi:MAG: class I SAM-dependent methyltransferase [Candidatus Gottesmanbacteria bacterium]
MSVKAITRNCPLCNQKKFTSLHTQIFKGHFSHHIVHCDTCGFIFVNNTPPQKYYDRYYGENSKYEGVRQHEIHDAATKSEIARFFKTNVPKDAKILDIGCSTGSMLAFIRDKGYKNVYGIDPALRCKEVAKEKYDIDVGTFDFNSFHPKKKYDVIIISQVLEHLIDIKNSVEKADSFLEDNGYIFIGVPDAGRFYLGFDEPFGEFSTEHINFFTESSLYCVMQSFVNVSMKSDTKVLFSVWKKMNAGKSSLVEYIRKSKIKQSKIQMAIDNLPNRLIVWGVGALTRRLLATTTLYNKVLFFVDSNQNLVGKSIDHIKIHAPDVLEKHHEPVLISSFTFRDEIVKYMKIKEYHNKILDL